MTEFDSGAWPSSPTVPSQMPAGYSTPTTPTPQKDPPLSPSELEARSEQVSEFGLRDVVTALAGFFTGGESAFAQLVEWAGNIIGSIGDIAGSIFGWIFDLPLISDLVEVLTGKEDGDLDDLGTFGLNIRYGIQSTIDSIVSALFGWVGDLFSGDDANQALQDAASTIAGLSAAVTALQNNQNNTAVGGTSAMVDFTTLSTGTTFGADFAHIRSGGGGRYGIVFGQGAVWADSATSDATDNYIYTRDETTTDHQKVWVASGSAPRWFNSGAAARVEIHGRKNITGDTYVFVEMEKYNARLGCVVGGVRTIFTTFSGFSFKANGVYALECGGIGGLRVYRLLEGNKVIMTHTEVGTTSQVGASYRYTGGLGFARASSLGSTSPGTMWAFAMGDNFPPTVVGSGARMSRVSTGNVNLASGLQDLNTGFFNSIGANTGDIEYDLSAGTFKVSRPDWYRVECRLKTATGFWPSHVQLAVKRSNDVIGDEIIYVGGDGGAISGDPAAALSGGVDTYLDKDDVVALAYNASSGAGAFTGEATGNQSWFSITATGNPNRSLVVVE